MRLALISDIHGNPIALDAVLRDISSQGAVTDYWVLGDLVAQGYDPSGVLARLAELPNAQFVRGNTDRYTLSGNKPVILAMLLGRHPTPKEVAAPIPPELVPGYVITAQGLAWTHGALAATG